MTKMQTKNTGIASSLGRSLTHNCQPVGGHHSLLGNIFGSQPQNIIVVTPKSLPLLSVNSRFVPNSLKKFRIYKADLKVWFAFEIFVAVTYAQKTGETGSSSNEQRIA